MVLTANRSEARRRSCRNVLTGFGSFPCCLMHQGGEAVDLDDEGATKAARLLKLLANEQRLTVLCRLSHAEMSVTEAGRIRQSQSVGPIPASRQASGRRAGRNAARRADDLLSFGAIPIAEKLMASAVTSRVFARRVRRGR